MLALQHLLAASVVVPCALSLVAAPARAGQADEDTDDLIRSELTLNSRNVRLTYDPALPSDHRSLLVLRAGSTQAAVRLGRLEGHRSLAIGTLAPDPEDPPRSGPDHDLWLMRTAAGWVLDARPVEEAPDAPDDEDSAAPSGEAGDDADAAGDPDAPAPADAREVAEGENVDAESADAGSENAEADARDADAEGEQGENAEGAGDEADESPRPGRIPLAHQALADETGTLTVSLLPAADQAGTLELAWGRNRWTTDFEFVELPRRPRPPRTSNVSRGTSLTRDSDLDARYRATALASRNETALVTPGGAHIQVLFEQELGTDHVDFAALESIGDGDLVELTEGAVIRLRSEVPLRFGDTLIPTDNLAPDFPGSYGLWLRASGPGWTLVFNNEPDSWGTQHDPAFDAAEVDIDHTHGGPYEDRPLAVSLLPTGGDAGRLVIHWGQHVWAADFTVEP